MTVGATSSRYIIEGIEEYLKRLKRYIQFSVVTVPDIKNTKSMTAQMQKEAEGSAILSRINTSDMVVLLDEKGKEYTSVEFSSYMQRQMLSGRKRLVFIIGGPYGFSQDVYERSDGKISLSRMTFNHEMVRLFFIEQIYRAMTILRGEPYHHE